MERTDEKMEQVTEPVDKVLAFKEKAIDQFQKMTVDRIVNRQPDTESNDDLLWMFDE